VDKKKKKQKICDKKAKKQRRDFNVQTLAKMKKEKKFKGKDYDLAFGWNDEKIYRFKLV
jgi:hypothetical protein